MSFIFWAAGLMIFGMLLRCLCCDQPCHFSADDFNRADLGANWDEAAGTASISSNKATVTATNAQIINVIGSASAYMVKAKITAASGSRIRVIGSWVDTSNFYWAEAFFSGGSSTVAVGEVVAGASTQKGVSSTFTLGSGTYTLRLCVLGTSLAASINAPSLANQSATGTASTGLAGKAGFGTGSAVSGTPTFDDWLFTRCGECSVDGGECDGCDDEDEETTLFAGDIDIEFHNAFTFAPASGQHPSCTTGLNNQTFTLTKNDIASVCTFIGSCPVHRWSYEGTLPSAGGCPSMNFFIGALIESTSVAITIFFCTPPSCVGSSVARSTFTGTFTKPLDCKNIAIPLEAGALIGDCPDCECGINLFANPEATLRA